MPSVWIEKRNLSLVRWRDVWGRKHAHECLSPEAALHFAQLKITDLAADRNRENLPLRTTTFPVALDLWLSVRPWRNPRTRENARSLLAPFSREFHSRPLQSIRPEELERVFAQIRPHLAPTTYYNFVSLARSLFRWLLRSCLISLDPLEDFHQPYAVSQRHREITYAEEAQAFQTILPQHRLKLLILFDQGLRLRDMLALGPQNLDFAQESTTLTVSKSLVRITLPWTYRLAKTLDAQRNLMPHGCLFSARPASRKDWWHRGKKRCAPAWDCLDVRHTFATRLRRVCHDSIVVNYCLGHKLNRDAETLYQAHVSLEELRPYFLQMERRTLQGLANCQPEISPAQMWRELEGAPP